MTTGSLTVLFEDPFWIGLFEMIDQQGLRACKVTFGAEPTEKEVKATLTVMEGGEHWFHTEEQMAFLDNWIKEKNV